MQLVHGGPCSSHLTRRRRQWSHPYRDLVCAFRGITRFGVHAFKWFFGLLIDRHVRGEAGFGGKLELSLTAGLSVTPARLSSASPFVRLCHIIRG
jgi:hypothetical protein